MLMFLQTALGPDGLERLGMLGLLGAAVVALWRAVREKDALISTLLQESEKDTAVLRELPAAIERLRAEVASRRSPQD